VAEVTLTAHHLNAAFWKQCEWKLREIPYDFETENVLNRQKNCFIMEYVTSQVGNFLMRGCIKRVTCNVNQMREFWCFFILTS
jgi:hypothetical protein